MHAPYFGREERSEDPGCLTVRKDLTGAGYHRQMAAGSLEPNLKDCGRAKSVS